MPSVQGRIGISIDEVNALALFAKEVVMSEVEASQARAPDQSRERAYFT